jgi:mono/diheme cytochrome c family protein
MTRLALFLTALLSTAAPAIAQASDGPTLYKRCAACHLPSGAGIPGAFPPLQSDFLAMASRDKGRRYLALVLIKGLAGPLVIEGKTYRGVMPAQTMLDDAGIAQVLNHVGTDIAKGGTGFRAFTAAEVAKSRLSGTALTSADVAALHATSGRK